MIVYECPRFVLVYKPHGLPTVPLKGQDADTLLSRVGKLYPAALEPYSEKYWEGGAIHRLDTDTAGLVLFALDKDFYNQIIAAQSKGLFKKTYTATCSFAENLKTPMTISSYFRAFGPGRKMVKPETDINRADSPVLYTTTIEKAESNVLTVSITRGFRHQIRSHLAWKGIPIKGDKLYNSTENEGKLQLECTAVEFPLDGSIIKLHTKEFK